MEENEYIMQQRASSLLEMGRIEEAEAQYDEALRLPSFRHRVLVADRGKALSLLALE